MKLSLLVVALLALAACEGKGGPAPAQPKLWEDFSGEKALAHVQRLVDFGPRPPASKALDEARNYLVQQLESCGWQVARQTFTDETPRGQVTFVNLVATFPAPGGGTKPLFLLCSHYDTKTFDDLKFVGANDGGSSNGVLLEMARVFATQPELAAKLELVFFDGEEAYVSFTESDGLYGSRYLAKQLVREGKAKQFRGCILFDMIGDRNLDVTLSPDSPAQMTGDIFAAAEVLKVRQHFTYANSPILDDHAPLQAVGIPSLDLIDFDYPPWHTAEDTMDKLSAESLRIVGAVATRYLIEVGLR